ncbi:MAG: AAA family ATPase [Pacificimonas sp.]
MQPRVIVLNGVGSVGKSSTAKALQKLSREPFLHVQGDAFLDMMSPRLWGDPAGIIFQQTESDGKPSIEIEMGPALDRLMDGMRRSVAALAKAGNSCIVDDVMLSVSDQKAYLDACSSITIQFVALRAPLEIIEKRERERGDRLIGLARWQFPRVHTDIAYDFEVDATTSRPKEIAQAIASALNVPLR